MISRRRRADTFHDTAPSTAGSELVRHGRRWRTLLGATLAAALVVLWTGYALHVREERARIQASTFARDAGLLAAAERYLQRLLANANAVCGLVAQSAARGLRAAGLQELLDDRLRNNDALAGIVACLPGGTRLASPAGDERFGAADCAALGPAPEPAAAHLAGPPVAGGQLAPFATAGGRAGWAVCLLPTARLLGLLDSFSLADGVAAALIGHDGVVRSTWQAHPADPLWTEPLLLQRARAGRPHQQRIARADGAYLLTVHPVAGQPLALVAASPERAWQADHQEHRLYLQLCVGATAGLLLAGALLLRMHAQGAMAARSLARARERLQDLNHELERLVQDRTAELERTVQDLESFSYSLAHDVRAPLAAIRSFAQVLEGPVRQLGDARAEHHLRRIQANAVWMEELTDGLLVLGRLSRSPLDLADTDLSRMAQEILARLAERDPHHRVDTAVQPGIRARGDQRLLRLALENLLGNAWKFGARSAAPRIDVSGDQGHDGWATLRIHDNGPGLGAEQAQRLFQPFTRGPAAAGLPGHGIGLAIVKRIAELHGGRVWAEPGGGAGATLCLRLPAARPDGSV